LQFRPVHRRLFRWRRTAKLLEVEKIMIALRLPRLDDSDGIGVGGCLPVPDTAVVSLAELAERD
jgi:hypothetical protein